MSAAPHVSAVETAAAMGMSRPTSSAKRSSLMTFPVAIRVARAARCWRPVRPASTGAATAADIQPQSDKNTTHRRGPKTQRRLGRKQTQGQKRRTHNKWIWFRPWPSPATNPLRLSGEPLSRPIKVRKRRRRQTSTVPLSWLPGVTNQALRSIFLAVVPSFAPLVAGRRFQSGGAGSTRVSPSALSATPDLCRRTQHRSSPRMIHIITAGGGLQY